MTIRNLDHLFRPQSIALIGASKRVSSVGSVLAKNLFGSGFDGPVMPVNPKHRSIQGVLTFEDVESLPLTPDLAVIATPPDTVPEIVHQLGERGTKAAVVITAGLNEPHPDGGNLKQAMLDAARPHLLRIIGPNCLGVLVPGIGLNASFAHTAPLPGKLAFVAQSGAVMTSVIDWAATRGIGFSHLAALGDMSDVDFGDMLDYLANDPGTSAILLYIEAITDARKFMSAGRAAARMKPVVVVKAGRHPEGARAAASHTGALAGVDAAYDTAFRRAGMLRVIQLEELFDAVQTLAMVKPPDGDRLAIVTNGGGVGVMAARFTQIDYDREMALVLTDEAMAGAAEIFGVARLVADPDNEGAEFAIVVGHDMTGQGLGELMMNHLITYARKRGVGEIHGEVLHKNAPMLGLCDKLAFVLSTVPDDPGIVHVSLDLRS